MTSKKTSPATVAAQALGWIDPVTRAVVPPVHPSSTFVRDPDNGYSSGRMYARADCPGYDQPEAVLTELEGGAAAALFAVFAVWIVAAPDMRFGSQPGEGAFYRIVPRGVMAGAAGAALAASLAALALGARAFWRDIAPSSPKGAWRRALPRAIREAVSLRHLGGRTGGGAAGCAERPARIRRLFHHAMVAGLAASFASTVVAALYERFLGWHGPYPVASLPVELGLVGGGFVLAGVAGLFWLKGRTDQTTIVTETRSIDQAFLALLAAVAASGLALLWLRDTPAIGLCLILHLGLVLAFFLVLPAGKFVHAIYRSAALLRAAIETRESQRGDGDSG